MRKIILLFILAVEISVYVFVNPYVKTKLKRVINIKNNNVDINNVKLENYVIGVVAAEMPATFSIEALKAQAVASRTFIYEKILNSGVSYDNVTKDQGQAYITVDEMKSKWKDDFDIYFNKIKQAVNDTKGEIIVYNNEPIKAYYFSSSNGKTEDSTFVFGDKEYLKPVDSSFDSSSKEYKSEKYISKMDFKNKLGINDDAIIINNIEKNETNHISNITINNQNFSGIDIRKKLDLRSTDFNIEDEGDNIKITTRGYGHGVGMSQYGANYLASCGKSYIEIIKYYYTNVDIKKI